MFTRKQLWTWEQQYVCQRNMIVFIVLSMRLYSKEKNKVEVIPYKKIKNKKRELNTISWSLDLKIDFY